MTPWQPQSVIGDRYQLLQLKRERPGHQVWLALDQHRHTKVILKCLAFTGAIEWDEVKLFEREVEILRRLQHPRTPVFFDAFTLEDPVFCKCLVESYIPAPSLQVFLDRQQPIPFDQIWAIAEQVLLILKDLHRLTPTVLHRDIKPSNILIDKQKNVYLVDFGSVGLTPSQTRPLLDPATTVGSYGYTPMEQFMGQTQPASDLYALGATLIHLLTQRPPSELFSPRLRLIVPSEVQLAAPLKQWIYCLTEPKVGDRPISADQALQDLQQAQAWVTEIASTPPEKNSRIISQETPSGIQIQVLPRWRSQTIANRDLFLLTALTTFPPVIGLSWAIALLSSVQGFGLLGTEILILGVSLFPPAIFAPKLLGNLLEQELELSASGLQLQRKVRGVVIQQWQFPWSDIQALQIRKDTSGQWVIALSVPSNKIKPFILNLMPTEAEMLYQVLESQIATQ